MKNAQPRESDYFGDLVFTLHYLPNVSSTMLKFALVGAILGYGASLMMAESLDSFANNYPDAVNITGEFKTDENEFLHTSRNEHFNQSSPHIIQYLPIYSSLVGAGAATLFALNKVSNNFSKALETDRQDREFNRNSIV